MTFSMQTAIPHRAPFLLLDSVEEISADAIRAFYTPRADDELWSRIYAGHYPGNPITPGVLLCEMMFQAAACMVREIVGDDPAAGVPVVTRVQAAKFKKIVPPGSRLEIRVVLCERLANAFFMKGTVLLGEKIAAQAEFAVAMADAPS